MRKTYIFGSRRFRLAALIATSMLVLTACGEKKQDPITNETNKPTADKKKAQPIVAEKPEPSPVSPDDPLLGVWEVVAVTGRYEEVNTGLVYDFLPNGKVKTHSISKGPIPGGRHQPGVEKGDVVENEWSWKRVSPNEIELTHHKSPMVAVITTTIVGDTMKFEWNKAKGGSVFTMERVK